MRRRHVHKKSVFILLFIISAVFILLSRGLFSSSGDHALKAVDAFYKYEQEGNFSGSWEMFHPYMKLKFTKGHYLQDRAHVFMNHFGVDTFTYSLGKPKKLKNWQPPSEEFDLGIVYKVPVTQVFKGKYGNFSLHQEVFVVRVKKDWMILWDYNK
ncbi:hypothetical protein F7731_10005 [Cytobacillus depressus]|uniref:DUF4878 domain-containing protein n=1 Tax=Cytobacillus depressus TaxID=1602942 RepID=A0A6L3V619_9BACI|nr:hypothetical protein [Cytobacillus depressus]KAB2336686.1 hypothetical protein F7731_10005 [Cytobacillus depressus]